MKTYSALAFFGQMIGRSLRYLIAGSIFFAFLRIASTNAAPEGFLQGHLKIVSRRPVELADATPESGRAQNYSDYPLIILTQEGKKQVARITADRDGHYQTALPAGSYILDVEGRVARRLHVKAQLFTVTPDSTVHVDVTISAGFGSE